MAIVLRGALEMGPIFTAEDWSSALCGAPHKADYVDASIMLSFAGRSSDSPVFTDFFGAGMGLKLNIISALS